MPVTAQISGHFAKHYGSANSGAFTCGPAFALPPARALASLNDNYCAS